QADEHGDDRNDDKEFDQRERRPPAPDLSASHGRTSDRFGDCANVAPERRPRYFSFGLVSTSKLMVLLPACTSLTTVLCSLYSGGNGWTRSSVLPPGGAFGSLTLRPVVRKARSSTRFLPTVTPFRRSMWYFPSLMTPPAPGPVVPSTGMNWIEPSSIG